MCLFVLHLPLLLPCLLFTRYLRIPHMYFATPAVLAGVGGGQLTLRSHVWTRGRVAQQGGDWWEGGSFKRTPMYSFVYHHF